MTINHEGYMATPPDMSGSIAKNRFRAELLWGVEKLLECLDKGIRDFAVVFDYRCDIELHLNDGYEFYQVKTSSSGKFGVAWACRKNPKTNVSVVGRLYELHDAGVDGSVRLVIVGNKHFVKKSGSLEEPGELFFSTLTQEDKRKIEAAIREHIPTVEPDLSKVSYLLVSMDLSNPENSVRGHLINTYETVMGCEVRKPNALYRALRSLAEEKACEERRQISYEEVIRSKAITSDELSALFQMYSDKENSVQDYVMEWIGKQPPLKRNSFKCAYEEIVRHLFTPQGSVPIRSGVKLISDLSDELTEEEIIEKVFIGIKPACGIEVTTEMRKVYAVVALYEAVEACS